MLVAFYMRRRFLGHAVLSLLFAIVFVGLATYVSAKAAPSSIAPLAYAMPAHLMFSTWQNWNRYTAER